MARIVSSSLLATGTQAGPEQDDHAPLVSTSAQHSRVVLAPGTIANPEGEERRHIVPQELL